MDCRCPLCGPGRAAWAGRGPGAGGAWERLPGPGSAPGAMRAAGRDPRLMPGRPHSGLRGAFRPLRRAPAPTLRPPAPTLQPRDRSMGQVCCGSGLGCRRPRIHGRALGVLCSWDPRCRSRASRWRSKAPFRVFIWFGRTWEFWTVARRILLQTWSY